MQILQPESVVLSDSFFFVLQGKYLGTLQSFSKNKLLQLDSNSSLAATENVSNLESPYGKNTES